LHYFVTTDFLTVGAVVERVCRGGCVCRQVVVTAMGSHDDELRAPVLVRLTLFDHLIAAVSEIGPYPTTTNDFEFLMLFTQDKGL
jgi:hypothetical protein